MVMVRGNFLHIQILISLECGNSMLCNLQRNGIHSLTQRANGILTAGSRNEGSIQTLLHQLHVDTTKHVYNSLNLCLNCAFCTRCCRSVVL